MKVALVYNIKKGPAGDFRDDEEAEWDSPETVRAVENALARSNEVLCIEADLDVFRKLRSASPEFVFNIAEGHRGPSREAQIPALCEMLGLPYTGSDPLTLALCLDKARSKQILHYYGIPTPAFALMEEPATEVAGLRFPLMVKPAWEGSSKGVADSGLVHDGSSLLRESERIIGRYHQPALVEAFLPGREFTVGIVGNGSTSRVLPLVEINLECLPSGANPIYSYEAKWIWDTPEKPLEIFRCPARVPDSLREEIAATALRAYRALGCRDWCRIDVRLDGEGIANVLELNPLPGVLPDPEENSCLPKAARAAGISYAELINIVLKSACGRYGIPYE